MLYKGIGERELLNKLRNVCNTGKILYISSRNDKPNLSGQEFEEVINRDGNVCGLKTEKRKLDNKGCYSRNAEDDIFEFEFEIEVGSFFGQSFERFYIKGYFFDKGNLKGVTIISFRRT